MFVTDPVEPLSSQLNQDPDKNLVIWGLYKIAVLFIIEVWVVIAIVSYNFILSFRYRMLLNF